jgi:hypothetical protein
VKSKYPAGWLRQRGTTLWSRGFCDNHNDPKYAAHRLSELVGNDFAAYAMGICDSASARIKDKSGKPLRKPRVDKLVREVKGMLK